MSACTFFGHRDCPSSVTSKLRGELINLIENHGVDMFYVGHQGKYDYIVRSILRDLDSIYEQINYAVVLSQIPQKADEFGSQDYSDTMLPEGIEAISPRFAISWRNRWMLNHSDYVVAYITHSWGGAAQFTELAKKQKKNITFI